MRRAQPCPAGMSSTLLYVSYDSACLFIGDVILFGLVRIMYAPDFPTLLLLPGHSIPTGYFPPHGDRSRFPTADSHFSDATATSARLRM
ncbi:hypothetical protein BO94DRAFT_317014 [Aspergillus sclerotioniger CBS 115572]|uniref:Uncharacterized protein n=1 Tax=Aspergillus sclerotioniger CBS 115572 TaxID=1450535 RepID=A0A317X6Q9_9EURO|nr:hypothetical protein BO94DRAFT_317014 [Aspergillus sclerotioniger CBS 115572]PWY94015.1 hypothetical protein BO94DRAFT_317014 [Aspergillus sclerotioniger CBS 115572]